MNERYIIEYLSSPQWKAKRKAVKKRCNDICERCHLYLVDEVHHLTYERIYNERLEDLQGLCAGCHEFLHCKSGIDPLQKSIHVTVSGKIIEFWDRQAGKHRRVNIAKLPPERFRWCRMYAGDKLIETFLENSQLGQFDVPMDVFLDGQGKAVLDPSRWERYRVASWIGNRWYSARRDRRGRPNSGESMKARGAGKEEGTRREAARGEPRTLHQLRARLPEDLEADKGVVQEIPQGCGPRLRMRSHECPRDEDDGGSAGLTAYDDSRVDSP